MRNKVMAIMVGPGEKREYETVSVYDKPGQEGEVRVKAVVAEGGELKLKGWIKIKKGAEGSQAFLRQQVLLLGDKSRATAEPILEIETDDVKASHAATVGQLNEEELFYLESRGMAANDAKKMLVEAYFGEIWSKIGKKDKIEIKSKLKKLYGFAN